MHLNQREKWLYQNLKEKEFLIDLAKMEGLQTTNGVGFDCPGILEIDRVNMEIKPSKKYRFTHQVKVLMDQLEASSASTASNTRETFLEALIEIQEATIQKLFDTNKILMDELKKKEKAVGGA